jgi:spore germination protein
MFIYTVRPGDSLYAISTKYDVAIDRVRLVNGLNETNIVPGQSLLIPSFTYTVQPGDSIYRIAKMAYVPVNRLLRANPSVNPNALQPGMKITIPDISDYTASTFGFYTIRSPELDRELINNFAPYHTYLSIFEYHFANNGALVNDLNDLPAIQTAWRRRLQPLMTVTNLTATGFSAGIAHQMLNDPAARSNLINNIYNVVSRKGYAGVNIDIEQVRTEDRDLLSGFLSQLNRRLKPSGYLVTISVPAKTNEEVPWLRGYDYGAIGSAVDLMFVMAYDWHHGGSEPGPVAPITEVRGTIRFALSRVRGNKIILGVPLYGYDWLLPYTPGTIAPGLSNQAAIETAMRYQSPIQYSTEYESPFFHYVDDQGRRHEVWFEDTRSMSRKMELVREFRLGGIGAWQISLGFPPGVWLLRKFFRIRKA